MKRTENYFMDRPQPGKAERKESHLNARHSGSMKTGYKEELPGRSYEHQAHKRKKASSTARGSSEDRPGRYDCSPARRQRMESVSSKASDCSLYSPLGSDCSVDSALGRDCSLDSPLGSDCSVDSALGSDCSVDRPMESDTSVSRTENSNPEPSVSSHDQHHGNRAMDDELFKKIFEKLLERRTYMWRKALLNKRDYFKGRSVRSRKSPVAKVTSATSRYSVGSPETTHCSVGSPEASDCPVDSPSIYSVRRVSPQKPQRSQTLGSPLAPVNSAATDCSVDGILRSRVNASENIFTEVEMEVLEKTSLKTFLMASHRRAAAAGSEAVHAFSQLATYVRNFIKEYPEDLERISKDDLNNLNEKDSFTASLLPPSAPVRVISMDSPMASVSSVASDCSEERFINFSSGKPQSSQPCRHCGSSKMNEGLQRHHSSFKKPFPGRKTFIGSSSQSSLPKASPAASEAYVDSPMASVSSVASDCSEERFINFSSGNPQSSQPCRHCGSSRMNEGLQRHHSSFKKPFPGRNAFTGRSSQSSLPKASPAASEAYVDSPMASVSSVASDCSEERFINFSSGNPQSSQFCSSPASVMSMDSPMASVSSVANDCSEDRFINFSSGNPQSSQPQRAAAGSDAPPVSLHDTGSSWLDTIEMTVTDYHFLEVNDLQSSPNTTSWSAPTPVYFQDSGIEMDETVSFHDDTETIIRLLDVTYDDLFSIIEDDLINLNEKASRTASASPSLPRMAAKEMIIAETASDTLMNSSGKKKTQRKPVQSKTTQRKPRQRKPRQCKTPQPNHNSKPDSSVNKENSATPGFYNQGTVSSSAHGSFINNGANYRSSGNHFTSVTAQAAETASHVMFEAIQATETAAASQLMLKGVQTPAEAEASQLMLKAAQVAAHAN